MCKTNGNLAGSLKIKVYLGGGEVRELTNPRTKEMIVDMYNRSCDIMNDDPGLIETLNQIWDYRHPEEKPNDTKELMIEYDRIHDRICEDVWRSLSWSHGIDWNEGKRYEFLSMPYLSFNEWVFSVTEHEL